MPVQFLLSRAALPLRRARLLSGRSLSWPLRVRGDGSLRSYELRLRLYGLSEPDNALLFASRLGDLLVGKSCRWRVVSIDGNGTLAILVCVEGKNPALSLLREGLVSLRGCGSSRLRAAQEAARRTQRGLWRFAEERSIPVGARPAIGFAAFPWWQG